MGNNKIKQTKTMVALEDLHIGMSPATKKIYVGTVAKSGDKWIKKIEISPEFFVTLFEFCPPGTTETISGGGQTFGIHVADVTKLAEVKPEEMMQAIQEAQRAESDRKKGSTGSGLLDTLGKRIIN